MAYNLASVRDRIRDAKLDDPGYEASIIDGFINDAQREIFNSYELPFMEKSFTGTLPSGEFIFSFPDDYQLSQSLKIVDPEKNIRSLNDDYLRFRAFNEQFPFPEVEEPGPPMYWTTYGNKLYLHRPTDQEYQLNTFYIKKPDELTDDAHVPEIPEEFQEALVLGAFKRVYQRNEDYDLAAAINQEYVLQTDLMAQRLGKRQGATPMVMGQPLRSSPRSRNRRN